LGGIEDLIIVILVVVLGLVGFIVFLLPDAWNWFKGE